MLSPQEGRETGTVQGGYSVPYKETTTPNGEKNVPIPPQSAKKVDIWETKPPDFSYKLYTSSTFPEIPSRTIKEEQRRNQSTFPESRLQLPSIKTCPRKATSPKFVTTFPRQDLQKTVTVCEDWKISPRCTHQSQTTGISTGIKELLIPNNIKQKRVNALFFIYFLIGTTIS